MFKFGRVLIFLLALLACAAEAHAQGYYQFLGAPRGVPDRFTSRYNIRYNTQGFDNPSERHVGKMIKKGAPQSAVQDVLDFPGTQDTIGEWVDQAFEQTRAEFVNCGGTLAQRALNVSPSNVYVVIEPSAFFVPEAGVNAAGVYYPDRREIHVLNIYYTWSGANAGWLRNARDLLKWEMENYFGIETGIQAEPRTPAWPCDAPSR